MIRPGTAPSRFGATDPRTPSYGFATPHAATSPRHRQWVCLPQFPSVSICTIENGITCNDKRVCFEQNHSPNRLFKEQGGPACLHNSDLPPQLKHLRVVHRAQSAFKLSSYMVMVTIFILLFIQLFLSFQWQPVQQPRIGVCVLQPATINEREQVAGRPVHP